MTEKRKREKERKRAEGQKGREEEGRKKELSVQSQTQSVLTKDGQTLSTNPGAHVPTLCPDGEPEEVYP